MPEVEVTEEEEKQAASAFAEGFNGKPTPEPAAVATEPEPAPKAEPEPTPAPPAPKYVQITEEDFASLKAAAGETATLKQQMSKAFGTIGDVQQIVKKLQSETPSGHAVDIPADAFTEMEADYPELAAQLKKGLERSLKGLRGTAKPAVAEPAPAEPKPSTIWPDDIQKIVNAEISRRETDALKEIHPTWREIVGTVDSRGQADPDNAFRKWLATQPADYQKTVNDANSATVISRAIEKFQASTAPQPKPVPLKPNPRAAIIRGAIQPKGDGGHPQPAKGLDDFAEGFRTG